MGWMDTPGMKVWFQKIFAYRPGGLLKKKARLVLDSFRGHLKEETKKIAADLNTHLAVIPGGLTSQLQPLDVSINKPFKVALQQEWSKWMMTSDNKLTPAGRVKKPSIVQVCDWVKKAWDSVKTEIVIKSFKKCVISNKMDGTEDDAIFEEDDEEDEEEDELLTEFLNCGMDDTTEDNTIHDEEEGSDPDTSH